MTELRRQLRIVFQDPYSSLNPRLSVARMLTERLLVHGICGRDAARERGRQMLGEVGLPNDAYCDASTRTNFRVGSVSGWRSRAP